jgi:hypothetical protein
VCHSCRCRPNRWYPALASVAGLLALLVGTGACNPGGGAARNPGSPAPVADPGTGPGALSPPRGDPSGEGAAGLPSGRAVPVRPDQAPLVTIQEALDADSLLGRRVRVAGRCTAAGAGRRAGSWTLAEAGLTIEVRGLVPYSCGPASATNLTIFAQIEPKAAGSAERLLLRLPD